MLTIEEKKLMAKEEWDKVRIEQAALYLKDIALLKRQVELAEQEVEAIWARLEGGAIRYDKPNVMTSPTDNKIPYGVADLVEAKKKLQSNTKESKKLIEEMTEKLVAIEGVAGFVLRFHYLIGFTYKQIAEELGMSEASVYLKRQEGLLALYESGLPHQYMLPNVKAV